MRTPLLALTVLTLGISTAGPLTAYLSPEDVFTDLEIPVEQPPATAEDTVPVQQEEPVPQPAPEEIQQEEPVPPPPTQEEVQQEEQIEQPSSEEVLPLFYRSGEQVEIQREAMEKSAASKTQNPFDAEQPAIEEQQIEPEPQQAEQEQQIPLEEPQQEQEAPVQPEVQQEPAPDEEVQPAAPQTSGGILSFVGRLKYILAAIALAVVAAVFFLQRKSTTAVTPSVAQQAAEQTVPTPAAIGPQNVEDSSERLQHALEAIGEEPETPLPEQS